MNDWLKVMGWKKASGVWNMMEIYIDLAIIAGVVMSCVFIYTSII